MLTRLRCLCFLMAALLSILSGCQADGDPTATADPVGAGQDGDEVEDGDQGLDDPDGRDDGENGDDQDDGEDGDDGGDDDERKPTMDCEAHADFLPLTKGIPALDSKIKAKAKVDEGCRDCEVDDEDAVIERNLLKSARMITPAGAQGGVSIDVELDEVRHGIEQAGFLVAAPDGPISDALLNDLELRLLRDDSSVERVRGGQEELRVYNTSDSYRQLLVLETDEPFDEIRVRMNGNGENTSILEVYAACVNRYGW